MHYYEVAPYQVVRADNDRFTYASPLPLEMGQLVNVEVGKKLLIGIVLHESKRPTYPTKEIDSVISGLIIPLPLLRTALWLSTYYSSHLAFVLQTILPRGIQKNRRDKNEIAVVPLRDRTIKLFTPEQISAINEIENMTPGTALLHGVTGSGKTTVYIELAKRSIAQNKTVIVLVPEIALTSQLVDEFSQHFANVLVTHSKQTEAQRHITWEKVMLSTSPQIIIGPRSALFLPVRDLGVVIIDEAHEPSFKQEQSPRYSALRAASVLASHHEAKVILGSATPAITDFYLAIQSGRPIITMKERARLDAQPPTITVVDMTKRPNFKQHRFISDALLTGIRETLEEGHQTLIFHNRRGSASVTLCEQCGWSANCKKCFVPFTLHADKHELRCHICGMTERVPTSCPECGSVNVLHKGIGTKLIESEIQKLFPNKKVIRFDGDSDTLNTLEKRYAEIYRGDFDIIIGTQIVAKGLDLPKLRAVGVIQADAGLSLPDYNADERTFQLLAQVVGRVGRSSHKTRVIVQTYQPTHPAVAFGLKQDYAHFYNDTLTKREKALFPPFVHLLKLTCTYKTEASAIKNAKKVADQLRKARLNDIRIMGPTPSFYEYKNKNYRWQLLIKSKTRSRLLEVLKLIPASHWQSELDPISLL